MSQPSPRLTTEGEVVQNHRNPAVPGPQVHLTETENNHASNIIVINNTGRHQRQVVQVTSTSPTHLKSKFTKNRVIVEVGHTYKDSLIIPDHNL